MLFDPLDETRALQKAGGGANASTSLADTIPGNLTTTEVLSIGLTSGETGYVNFAGDTDWFRVSVVAGMQYTFVLVGYPYGGAPVSQPLLRLYDAGGQLISTARALNPGGSAGENYTATVSGTIYVSAGAVSGTGRYALSALSSAAPEQDRVGDTTATAAPLAVGQTVEGGVETAGDVDMFRVELTAGVFYEFTLTETGSTDFDPYLELFDAGGRLLDENDDIDLGVITDSRLGFMPTVSGTYYIGASDLDLENTGRYRLNLQVGTPGNLLNSIDWGTQLADTTVDVYFIPAGENHDGYTALGWTDYEIAQAFAAMNTYAAVSNLRFVRTTDPATAEFRLVVTDMEEGTQGLFYTPGGPNAGLGIFSRSGFGWDETPGEGEGLRRGGAGFATLVHEIGHGLGLAHPHDRGGGSEAMSGVNQDYDSFGLYGLNQGVFTTMSYNDGWMLAPGGRPGADDGSGRQAGPMALDIAVSQAKYGAVGRNDGNTTYTLPDGFLDLANGFGSGAGYIALWDTGGVDRIVHPGAGGRGAVIDLRAATLDYSATGGGVVSYINGVNGGFTIAAGVVIEEAQGGSAGDRITGNAAANLLLGEGGNDTLIGGGGADTLDGGEGFDVATVTGDVAVSLELAGDVLIALSGRSLLRGVEAVAGGGGADTLRGGFGAERLEGRDGADLLSGLDAADKLFGGGAEDALFGNAGDDFISGDDGDDYLDGQEDGDFVLGGFGRDRLLGGDGVDLLGGEDGDDQLWGGFGGDNLFGASGADRLWGEDGDDHAHGGADGDNLYGGAGFDVVFGDEGDDLLDGGEVGDFLMGGVGLDQVLGGAGGDFLAGEDGDDRLFGGSDDDNVYGGRDRDELWGENGNDFLAGEDGDDVIGSGAGRDTMDGGAGSDRFVFFAGDSVLGAGDKIVGFQSGTDRIDVSFLDADPTQGGDQAFRWAGLTDDPTGAGSLRLGFIEGVGIFVFGYTDGDGVADFLIDVGTFSLGEGDFIL